MSFFDTHAHLNTDAFSENLDDVLTRAQQAGVSNIAVIGIDLATSRRAVELAQRYPDQLHAVVGIQPNSVAEAGEDDFDQIAQLANQPSVVGIGETGLDCYWDDTPIDQQQQMFDKHMDLCLQRELPMVIHMRQSCDLIITQLQKRRQLPAGIMHSFTGDIDQCRSCLDLGLMISFAGMVTFKKSDDLRAVARTVPADRLLIETDSPYLSPEPLRGKRPNEPARVVHTLKCLAEVRGVAERELASITTQNARNIFGLDDRPSSANRG